MKRKGLRRKGILWEYNYDGAASRERIKGADKRYWKRWLRRFYNKLTSEQEKE